MWRMNTWFFGPCNGHWPLGNFFLFLSASVTAYLEQRRAFVFLPTRCEMRTLLMFTTVARRRLRLQLADPLRGYYSQVSQHSPPVNRFLFILSFMFAPRCKLLFVLRFRAQRVLWAQRYIISSFNVLLTKNCSVLLVQN